jgi:hypothetical protein
MKALSFLKFLPEVVTAVRTVEGIMPGKGLGQVKLELVLGLVEDAVEDYTAVAGTVTKWTGRIVKALNNSGEFKQ